MIFKFEKKKDKIHNSEHLSKETGCGASFIRFSFSSSHFYVLFCCLYLDFWLGRCLGNEAIKNIQLRCELLSFFLSLYIRLEYRTLKSNRECFMVDNIEPTSLQFEVSIGLILQESEVRMVSNKCYRLERLACKQCSC